MQAFYLAHALRSTVQCMTENDQQSNQFEEKYVFWLVMPLEVATTLKSPVANDVALEDSNVGHQIHNAKEMKFNQPLLCCAVNTKKKKFGRILIASSPRGQNYKINWKIMLSNCHLK